MPDNWGYVAAAYAVAVIVLGGYWRRLARRERELAALNAGVRAFKPRHETGPRTSLQ